MFKIYFRLIINPVFERDWLSVNRNLNILLDIDIDQIGFRNLFGLYRYR